MRPLFLLLFLFAAAQPQSLRVESASLPAPIVSQYYNFQLQAGGGVPPYKWSLAAGALPPGLRLEPSGLILGTPEEEGNPHFTVRVTDSSTPPRSAARELTAEVKPSISLAWSRSPRVENGGIFGSVVFANNLRQSTDLTLIIVGVNEFNKSFVLGYQHATISPRTTTPEIPFGFTLPRGAYIVHADAYAERGTTLLHTRLQTPAGFQVP